MGALSARIDFAIPLTSTLDAVIALSRARRVLIDGRSLSARQRLRVRQAAERNGAVAEDLPGGGRAPSNL